MIATPTVAFNPLRGRKISERLDRLIVTALIIIGVMGLMAFGKLQESAGVGLLGLAVGNYFGNKRAGTSEDNESGVTTKSRKQ